MNHNPFMLLISVHGVGILTLMLPLSLETLDPLRSTKCDLNDPAYPFRDDQHRVGYSKVKVLIRMGIELCCM